MKTLISSKNCVFTDFREIDNFAHRERTAKIIACRDNKSGTSVLDLEWAQKTTPKLTFLDPRGPPPGPEKIDPFLHSWRKFLSVGTPR